MIRTNYHTHTSRCGHAISTDEDYVTAAIANGLTVLGFSDHAAYPEPHQGERMNLSQVPEYMQSIRSLAEQYKDKIHIYLGMEVEYYPDQWSVLSKYRREMDYCILGQHNISYEKDSSYDIETAEDLNRYIDAIEESCRRNLADYVCHPDVALFSYPVLDEGVRKAAERLAKISIHYNIPMELNCGTGVIRGLHQYKDSVRYAYPTRIFFEEFAKYQAPVIIGLDVHDPKNFYTDTYLNRALSVVEGLDIHFLDNYDLPSAAKKRKELFVSE